MGCGVSSVGGDRTLEKKGSGSKKDRNEQARKLMKVESKLGSKKIVNSFVVASAKAKARKRESYLGDHAGTITDAASALEAMKETFALPAENVLVSEPGMQGVATSGPSFKMARGKRVNDEAAEPEELQVQRALDAVTLLKEKLYSNEDEGIMEAAMYFRERLSVANPPVGEIRMLGVVPRLVQLLARDSSCQIQHEAAWALTNICSADHEDCQDVVDQGAVPALVRLLSTSRDAEVLQQVIWALGNIAADSSDMQQTVIDEGVLDAVLHCMLGRHLTISLTGAGDEMKGGPLQQAALIRQASWLLSNMCRPRPQDDLLYGALPVLESIIGSIRDAEALTHMCWTLAYMSSAEEGLDRLAASPIIMKQLAVWMSEPTLAMSAPSLRTVGNICSGSAACTQAVSDAEGIAAIVSCMKKSTFLSVRKECIWSLSNLAVGSSKHVQKLAEAGAFRDVIAVMKEADGDEGMLREAAYVLANPWSSSIGTEATAALIEQGVIHELVELLMPTTSEKILKVVMDGLKDAVKKGMVLGLATATEDDAHHNPVVVIMRSLDTQKRLEGLSSGTSEMSLVSMVNTLINALSLDE